ncbi:MAG TPA: patatin-like phospholipase family protein [Polyangiales bacterium]|nr:patatin-like phospholipase family protein [Polyangiales bacterium]
MAKVVGASVRRAIVLGGGGILGAYWEAGLLRGLADGGLEPFAFDAIVGTSAGAMGAVALANGHLPLSPDQTRAWRIASGRSPDPSFPFDLGGVDPRTVMRVFELWATMPQSRADQCAAIGALARQSDRQYAAAWTADFETSLANHRWVDQRLRVVAVDAVSGERRVFQEADGAPLPRAVAASCALPGICPPVEIEGRLYMDGGVHSTTNADLLVAERPNQVLILMPSNARTMTVGAFAERMLEQEVSALRAIDCDVRVVTPSARDTQRFGSDMMNYARVDDAYAAGLEAGLEWQTALRS